jgi:hypothetical protein
MELPVLLGYVDYRLVLHTPILSPWRDPQNIPDEELIFRRRPHDHRQGAFRGGNLSFLWNVPDAQLHPYDLHYDQNGFRNGQDLTSADVVVLGDSFVEGTYVSDAEVLTSVIARRTDLVVANLGLSAYGPQQELAALRRYGLPLKPQAVILVFFEGNDLQDASAYALLRSGSWNVRHNFIARGFTKNALSALYRLAGEPRPSALPRSAWVTSEGETRERAYFLYAGKPLSAADEKALTLVRDNIKEIHDRCAAHGILFILAFAPTNFRVYHDLAEIEPGSEPSTWVLNDLPARMRALARSVSKDIVFVDLGPALIESARRRQLPFFADDSHWSAIGHQVVGVTLSEFLTHVTRRPL